jgi:hypothetical protein
MMTKHNKPREGRKEVMISGVIQNGGDGSVDDLLVYPTDLSTDVHHSDFTVVKLLDKVADDEGFDGLAVDPTNPNTDVYAGDFLVERWQTNTVETEWLI